MNANEQAPAGAPNGSAWSGLPRPRYRHRHPALAAAGALAMVVTLAGAARAEDGHLTVGLTAATGTASYLRSNPATVASSVSGALVDIVSTEAYQGATAAGTGMVLSSTGEILTNNHVIDGATSIRVTVVSTGRTYTATVVGTDPTQDVAVLQLAAASGLKTLPISTAAVTVGQKVVARGNAGGVGGAPSTVTGTVTALAQSITATDDSGSNAEQLTGLIETDAPIVAGDSGGALATTSGTVIGMDTAASASNSFQSTGFGGSPTAAQSQSYAIAISTALSIAHEIETGQASSTIHLGVHGFLGVELAEQTQTSGYGTYGGFGGYGSSGTTATSGVAVAGVMQDGAVAAAGLQAGDVITSVNGTTVDSTTALNTIMATTRPGQKINLGWTDTSGQTYTATVTLGTAAAD